MKKITFILLTLFVFNCSTSDDHTGEVPSKQSVRLKKWTSEDSYLIFDYNDKNKLILTTQVVKDGSRKDFKSKYIYEDEKVVKIEFYRDDVHIPYEDMSYIYEGNQISKMVEYLKDQTIHVTEYSYDAFGNMVSERFYTDGEYGSENTYTHYPDGNVKSKREYSYGTTIFTYDDKKNPLYYAMPEAVSKVTGEVSKSNLVSISHSDFKITYEYNEYDFPTKGTGSNGIYKEIDIYEYESF